MRTALILTLDPPSSLGGQEVLVRSMATALEQRGYAVRVLHRGNSLPPGLARLHESSRAARHFQNIYVGLGCAAGVAREALARGAVPDIVISCGTVGWLPVPAKRRFHMYTGTYAGVAETSRDFITYPGYLKLKYWDAHIFERLAGVHAESMAAGNQIADEVMERFGHKTTQMWLPVDMERFRPVDDKGPLRRKFGLPEGATVVSWIGNAMPYKGLHTVAELARRRRDLHWLLVARGGVPDDVKRLPNVTLIENMPYAELHQVYQASDLAITPYRIGPFCFTMAEAMATALPLLCSPAHGVPEFIKAGPLGVLVVDDQANVDGFMAALEAYQRDAQGMKADALALREEMRPLMDVADWNERLMAELERGLK